MLKVEREGQGWTAVAGRRGSLTTLWRKPFMTVRDVRREAREHLGGCGREKCGELRSRYDGGCGGDGLLDEESSASGVTGRQASGALLSDGGKDAQRYVRS